MVTLEDKLLGEKLEYYCSSSEDEPNDESELKYEKTSDSQKCESNIYPSLLPPGGYRYQSSSNTGPKGVVEDWQRFKQLQAEKRAEDELQRIELAKKLTMTVATDEEEAKNKLQDDIDQELAELMSEDFLQQYQKERMAEMLKQCGGEQQHFGQVYTLSNHAEFLDCVEKAHKHTTIIIHIHDTNLSVCNLLNKCLDDLAKEYSTIKFAKMSTNAAGMSRDFRNKGLPALLVYKNQGLIGNFVHITDELSDDFFSSDVENFLIDNGIIIDKQLYK